jgi:hypothetical protein
MLFAAGGVAIERWASRGWRWWVPGTLAVLSAVTSFLIMPFAVPVMPVETFIKYSAALGVKPSTPERNRLADLPQYYADMFGWEELARDVSAVYLSLPEAERAAAVVYARNYGEAASLEYFSSKYPLPRVLSPHNNYWIWGYPRERFGTVIVLRGRAEEIRQACDEVTLAAVHRCRYGMPYENDMPIYVCRGLRVTPAELWRRDKNFS